MPRLLAIAFAGMVISGAPGADIAGSRPPEPIVMSRPGATPAAAPAETADGRLAQAFGTRCASQVGICPIVPAPIGFYCQCGPYTGTVIP